ncbi:MAG TPA: c-type cytochrome [Bryobacteraceae bacterium]|jgi:cytochrome c oxidase subunit 2|nr:c-type cytochrome [Bryobacteraceae bacterium]
MSRRRTLPAISALLLSACAGPQQSSLNSAGPQAGHTESLWWVFLGILSLILIAVLGVMLAALARRHPEFEPASPERTAAAADRTERRLTRAVAAATIATVAILFFLLVASVSTGKTIAGLASPGSGLTIEVTGNQWWWYVRYLDDNPQRIAVTANEIHIPVGRPVQIRGTSQDVIHSFWVPGLNGKRDLIPSHITTEWIQADRPGRLRGQCAEFCGLQHARMALWVVAEPESQFEAWLDRQRQPAVPPSDADTQAGYQVFMSHACVLCHNIAGTPAHGQFAPDLTHLAGRMTIAAGALPNNKGTLGGWILDPQSIKPGNHMATISLKPGELQPLLDYLGSLQ